MAVYCQTVMAHLTPDIFHNESGMHPFNLIINISLALKRNQTGATNRRTILHYLLLIKSVVKNRRTRSKLSARVRSVDI